MKNHISIRRKKHEPEDNGSSTIGDHPGILLNHLSIIRYVHPRSPLFIWNNWRNAQRSFEALLVHISEVLNTSIVAFISQTEAALINQALVTDVLEPGRLVQSGLGKTGKSNKAVVREGGRAHGVDHSTKDLRWKREAGAIEGHDVIVERPINL